MQKQHSIALKPTLRLLSARNEDSVSNRDTFLSSHLPLQLKISFPVTCIIQPMQRTFTLLLCTLLITTGFAQTWQRTAGPVGGTVQAIHLHSSGDLILSMGGAGENYRSNDNGKTWKSLSSQFDFPVVSFSEDEDGALYAAVPCAFFGACGDGSGIYRSTDVGDTWEKVSDEGFGANAFLYGNDGTMFMGFGESFSYGIRRSDDGGNTWTTMTSTAGRVDEFAETDSAYYAACTSGGLLKLAKGTDEWQAVDLPCGPYCQENGPYIANLTVDNDGVIYVADSGDGAIISEDEGATWQEAKAGLLSDETGLIATWGLFSSQDNKVYLWLYDCHVYEYIGGGTWLQLGEAIPNSPISYAMTSGPDGQIWAGAHDNGVYSYNAQTDEWSNSSTGLVNPYLSALFNNSEGTVFAGDRSLQKSDDQGFTWSDVAAPSEGTFVMNKNNEIYLFGESVFRSSDSGLTWDTLGQSPVTSNQLIMESDFNLNGDVFAIVLDFQTGLRSLYRGDSEVDGWTQLDVEPGWVTGLEIADDGTVYVASGQASVQNILISTDNGETWSQTGNAGYDQVYDMEKYDDMLIVGTIGQGVHISLDNGVSWADKNDGLPIGIEGYPGPLITKVLKASNGDLFVANVGLGIYRSIDNGDTWEQYADGLLEDGVTQTDYLIEANEILYLGSPATGVYRSESLSTSIEHINSRTTTIMASPNYPNPFADETNIPLELERRSDVSITIFNQTGRRVTQLFEGELPAGSHNFTLDAVSSGMRSGIYYCQITCNLETLTMKMIVVD